VPLWIALVVAGPLNEELLFRGFLYRGWARSPRAVVPAVVAISMLWASIHAPGYEYDWFIILQTGPLVAAADHPQRTLPTDFDARSDPCIDFCVEDAVRRQSRTASVEKAALEDS
jgi:Type II CAAX prenyl endopeptidase Rce1-like